MTDGGLAGPAWSGFSDAFHRGWQEILVLKLLRNVRRGEPRTWLPWLLASAGPLVLALLLPLLPFGWACSWSSIRWDLLEILALLNGGALAAAALAWSFAMKNGASVDALLSTCAVRDSAMRPVYRAMSVRAQLVLPLGLALIPLGVLLDGLLRGRADLVFCYECLAVAWTLLIVGNDIWWLLVPPLIIIRIAGRDDLNLIWHDPARTPGIRTFAEGYGFSALFLIAGAVFVVLPGVPWHPLFDNAFAKWVYAALLLLSLWIGAMTQTLIYMLTRRKKLAVMRYMEVDQDLLWPQERFMRPARRNTTELADSLTAYAAVAAAPNLPYGSAVVVQYVAAVVGSVVGFILQAR
ncbi:hypothetical protein ACTOB_002551 [Actinoplanes oblitus]|uniref:Uncharacterized protein n=1 Tax=Actinoplanes oblitus TaxID=3040509 RepID=A0ABY8WM37_9ACTN|nr:hypothetical protein [Actinoplanes oblitus]WIM98929.1 hypothetical protein ACTOB_002551 [Actinoplanes oblitus]